MFIKNSPITIKNLNSSLFNIHLTSSKKHKHSIFQDFSNLIKESIYNVNKIQNEANRTTKLFEINPSKISLNNVMINLEKSSIAIQMAVQIKNKIISAYRDIMNIQL